MSKNKKLFVVKVDKSKFLMYGLDVSVLEQGSHKVKKIRIATEEDKQIIPYW